MPIDARFLRRSSWEFHIAACFMLFWSIGCGRAGGGSAASREYWWPEQVVTSDERRQEVDEKTGRLTAWMQRSGLAGIVIRTPSGFAWLTAGSETPVPVFVDAAGRKILFGSSAECARLLQEDLKGMDFEMQPVPWNQAPLQDDENRDWESLAGGRPVGSDSTLAGARLVENELEGLQRQLTGFEIRKYRWLGKIFAEAVESACLSIPRGMNERAIEAAIFSSLVRRAIRPVSIMVSSDARIGTFGVAPPDDEHKAERAFLVRVCGRRWGLHVEITRLVSFGAADADVSGRVAAAAQIEARFWARTVPGASPPTIAAQMDRIYEGFPGEWLKCIPGGWIGYRPAGQAAPAPEESAGAHAFCWRPCIGGLGMSDTILLNGDNFEVLTRTANWPVLESRAGGRIYRTAGILER